MSKSKVLFVCIHNSGRSQMAEALLRHLDGEHFEAESAGFEPGKLNSIVVESLKEIGIDISNAKTKSVFDLYKQGRMYQYVVTVCDESSSERCPLFPGVIRERMHWSFKDPSSFEGSHEERLAKTRVVRDEIKAKIEEFVRKDTARAQR
ncbi:MAG: arsenate reductase ArsC [Elusimicrobiota bacterium]|nr:arsenate reductase ArsC [Elusimicrobiota bacterium]